MWRKIERRKGGITVPPFLNWFMCSWGCFTFAYRWFLCVYLWGVGTPPRARASISKSLKKLAMSSFLISWNSEHLIFRQIHLILSNLSKKFTDRPESDLDFLINPNFEQGFNLEGSWHWLGQCGNQVLLRRGFYKMIVGYSTNAPQHNLIIITNNLGCTIWNLLKIRSSKGRSSCRLLFISLHVVGHAF